jgi:hypothetical protein
MTGMWVPFNTLASSTSKPGRQGVDMILLSIVKDPLPVINIIYSLESVSNYTDWDYNIPRSDVYWNNST